MKRSNKQSSICSEKHQQSPVVISFYTLDTPYQQEVLPLISSCEMFGLEARIEGRKSLGSWENNCAQKPFFILQKLYELKRPILWVDADASFLKNPRFDHFPACDASVRINAHLPKSHLSRVLSGTLFVNYTPPSLALMQTWAEECERGLYIASELTRLFGTKKEGSYFFDQVALQNALSLEKTSIVHPLPLSYCTIFDLDREDILPDEIVIEHRQASRRCKPLL